ncbi:hypothetical protein E2C01_045348 [Portunus trituberculatus]|uniref:Uncharacterized protein n=1 Tax=Portunus trituberculatus TaxID=210409 RepID=A0A5B7FVI7_PORTR|nr:hypothetical protein [Portunus trituberculatus]
MRHEANVCTPATRGRSIAAPTGDVAVKVNMETESEFQGGGGGDSGRPMGDSYGTTWGFSLCFFSTLWVVFSSFFTALELRKMYS